MLKQSMPAVVCRSALVLQCWVLLGVICDFTFGRRAFYVAGPTVWNSLPTEFRELSFSFGDFSRRSLKTILFARY